MSYDFNADDVFEMAEQMERNGAQFYRNAAAGMKDSEAVKLLEELAAMEDDHEKTFAALRKDLTAAEKTSTVFDPDGESVLYLRALADTRVFFEKKVPDASDGMEAILKSAIEAEKDSIVFYLGLKDMVPENLGKDRLEAIIREEMGHIRLLSGKLKDFKK